MLRLCLFVLLSVALMCDVIEAGSIRRKRNIEEYQDDVNQIIEYVMNGNGKHKSHTMLGEITDKFGHRLAPSDSLENCIDYVIETMTAEGYSNVIGESFTIPNWRAGTSNTARMTSPREYTLDILPLGTSVGADGVEAEIIVVDSFDELEQRANEVTGKIVVYNQPWVNYGVTNMYRTHGARRASEKGAVAALVRSVTDYSVYSPHTGVQDYGNATNQIPVACITQEDSEMFRRMHDRGVSITVRLDMDCGTDGDTTTRNVVAELTGSEKSNETVIFGGHIDSWDVGSGVMDDMAGVVISWEAMRILQELNLLPQRTIRSVFWSAEEIGVYGGEAYYEAHKEDADSISLVMESDIGTFKPNGIGFSGNQAARDIMTDIMGLLSSIGATSVGASGAQADNGPWMASGVPLANLDTQNEDYFIYHHTAGDTLTMQDPDDLDLCTILWTTVAYVVADMGDLLPRD